RRAKALDPPHTRSGIHPQRYLKGRARKGRTSRKRNLSALIGRRFRGLAAQNRRFGRSPIVFLSRRTKTVSCREPYLPSSLRRGLVLHCRVDRLPSFLRLESGRRATAGE